MLNSKSNNTKLIMETWRRFLNEDKAEKDNSVNIEDIVNKMADQINIESIKEGDKRLDPKAFAATILGLTLIASGVAVPSILNQMAGHDHTRKEVVNFVNQYNKGGISCGAGPFQLAQEARNKQSEITFVDKDGKEVGDITDIRTDLKKGEARNILKDLQRICAPGL
tara:strand:- start:208 stop:708 length:501 start_codon:yes stop_codon:yes gene_type:complete